MERAPQPSRRTLSSRLRRPPGIIGLLGWFGVVTAIWFLANTEKRNARVRGYVRSPVLELAPVQRGSLASVAVQPLDFVVAGQSLATMACAEEQAALASAQAELARLRAERARAESALPIATTDRLAALRTELRRFLADRDESHLDVLRTEASLAEDVAKIQRLDLDLARHQQLGSELVSGEQVDALRIQHQVLTTRIERQRAMLDQQRRLLEQARQRAEDAAAAPRLDEVTDVVLAPYDHAITAQLARVDGARSTLHEMTLRAPCSGQVAEVLRRQGEVVGPGEPVLTLVTDAQPEIEAYLPEGLARRIEPGTQVTVSLPDEAVTHLASVVRFGAAVVRLPARAQAGVLLPQWGVPTYFSCPWPRHQILPGQELMIGLPLADAVPLPQAH